LAIPGWHIRVASIAGVLIFGTAVCLADDWIQLATTVIDQPTCGVRINVSHSQGTFSTVRVKVIEGRIKIKIFALIMAGKAPGQQRILMPLEPFGAVFTEGQSFSFPLDGTLDAVAVFGDQETCSRTRIEISALKTPR
jgi:hypothetical protein